MVDTPRRAYVRPRVLLPDCSEPARAEDAIRALCDQRLRGVVCLAGGPGTGKSCALSHLAAVLRDMTGVTFVDDADKATVERVAESGLVVYAARVPLELRHRAEYRLAPWNSDDWIEYLLAVRKAECASVMARLRAAPDRDLLGGLPELCVTVLDELAADASLTDVASALRRHLNRYLVAPRTRRMAQRLALELQLRPSASRADVEGTYRLRLGDEVARLITFPTVQRVLAIDGALAALHARRRCKWLYAQLPTALLADIGRSVQDDGPALTHMHTLFARRNPHTQPNLASLLAISEPTWKPPMGYTVTLAGARLPRVQWAGVNLNKVKLTRANLHGADLSGADLAEAEASGARFSAAYLHGALLREIAAGEADFSAADLSFARAARAIFSNARFIGANLEGALLQGVWLYQADLSEARLVRADLVGARFIQTRIERADFTGADLRAARLSGHILNVAEFGGARFARAQLEKCDLEGMRLPAADFTLANLRGALLTGSYIPAGCFDSADLSGTGLADVDWEQANLRRADLSGATFHMGSSRSGLVFSPFASEGTRSGFYTDEYDEQLYRAPEDIRKANLRGADLRGANIDRVDFYLVDLREARYDPDQAEHLRRCGAILETRV